tara:strand:+ start:566 stop:793 length:228 start_codon:yes stop_codon:yes gene_type:complete
VAKQIYPKLYEFEVEMTRKIFSTVIAKNKEQAKDFALSGVGDEIPDGTEIDSVSVGKENCGHTDHFYCKDSINKE